MATAQYVTRIALGRSAEAVVAVRRQFDRFLDRLALRLDSLQARLEPGRSERLEVQVQRSLAEHQAWTSDDVLRRIEKRHVSTRPVPHAVKVED